MLKVNVFYIYAVARRLTSHHYYYYYYYYYMFLLTLHMYTFDGLIVGADGIPWWSPSQVLATNYCVCACNCLSGIYYSGPSW